jgi:peroxiredoxin
VCRKTNTISKLLSSVILLLVAVFAIGCVTTGGEPELTPASAHPKAPDVTFRLMDGTQTKLSDYAGNSVVVINFWGLRCQNCIEEMPFLERLHNKYGSKGLLIIGVNTDGVDEALLPRFMPQLPVKISYPVAVDPEFIMADSFQMMAAPLSVIVAKDGTVRYRHEGYQHEVEAEFVQIVESLLAE